MGLLMDTVTKELLKSGGLFPEELQQMQVDVPGILWPTSTISGIFPTLNGNRQAEQMFRQSIALDSSFAPAYYELGFRLSQLASYTMRAETLYVAAESAFLKAISLNGGMLSAYGNLASNYAESGQTERAYETAQKILSSIPTVLTAISFGTSCATRFLNRAERDGKALSWIPTTRGIDPSA
jgi:tetratricopeptide (TPR) repeat protein